MGTFGGALEARNVSASGGKLSADVRGEVENEERVLVLKRIHVTFRLAAPEEMRPTIERVHSVFARGCPVYRSLRDAIEITSSYELVSDAAGAARE